MRIFFIIVISIATQISAEYSHAMARFSAPKYSVDFTNFSYANPNAPKGGQLTLATIGTFDTANPHSIKGIKAQGMLNICFAPLMYRNPEEPFALYGLVAESVEIAHNASSVTFKINKAARFHDGNPITSYDVQFTYEHLAKHGLPVYRNYYSKISRIETPDEHTITLYLKPEENGTFNPELPFNLALCRPLPSYQLRGKEISTFSTSPKNQIIGSGPYKIKEIIPGRTIVYERVKNYWAKEHPTQKGKYNFDNIKIDYYKTTQAQFQAFTAGEFDVYFETNPTHWQSAYKFNALTSGKVKKVDLEHKRPVAVRSIIYNMKKPIFKDPKVRKAISISFDFDTINRMVFSGEMKPAGSLFANTNLAHSGPADIGAKETLKLYEKEIGYPYQQMILDGYEIPDTSTPNLLRENLSQAQRLLSEAGWQIKDGICINDKGEKLELELMYKDPKLEKIVLSFGKTLKKVGITLKAKYIETTQYENRVNDRDFDMIIHTWANSNSPGNEQVYFFGTDTANVPGSSNYMGLSDKTADTLAKRLANSRNIEDLIVNARIFDRYICNMYYQVLMFYDNKDRWAYWVDKMQHPKINPEVGSNVIALAWSPNTTNDKDQGTQTPADQDAADTQTSFFAKVGRWFQDLF